MPHLPPRSSAFHGSYAGALSKSFFCESAPEIRGLIRTSLPALITPPWGNASNLSWTEICNVAQEEQKNHASVRSRRAAHSWQRFFNVLEEVVAGLDRSQS